MVLATIDVVDAAFDTVPAQTFGVVILQPDALAVVNHEAPPTVELYRFSRVTEVPLTPRA
jgi:hypothetical protein